jgi:hypothetical protein
MSVEIRSQRAVALRPIVAAVLQATVITLVGAILGTVDRSAFPTLLLVGVFALIFGVGRAGLWLMVAGRVSVAVSDDQVVLARGARENVYPRSLVDTVRVSSGDAWPEWSRWALFPHVVIRFRDGHRVTRKILLSHELVNRANRELFAVIPGSI